MTQGDEEWIRRMVALEEELGEIPPNGASGGLVVTSARRVANPTRGASCPMMTREG